jgi:hypothetical protein
MESVHVVDDQIGHTTRNAITGKGRDVEPDSIARDAQITWIWFGVVHAMSELPLEAEPIAIEVLCRRRVRDMEERDRELKQGAPPYASDILRRKRSIRKFENAKRKAAGLRGLRPALQVSRPSAKIAKHD